MKRKIKRDRKVKKGFDIEKMAKIWKVLKNAEDWLHVAEISRRTNIHEATVRWYLDRYLKNVLEEERIVPNIRLRLVKLKPDTDFKSFIKALNFINTIKTDQNAKK